MIRIEAVLLDLDDALRRYERSPGQVLPMSFERTGIEPTAPGNPPERPQAERERETETAAPTSRE
ncbi:hypothetical protein [Halobiforma nitratireducens]|uniref:hypothetical protein n=1 Tax=Halobiforma nitratireducens TaxID=130048 RepID=UPI001461469F|nr:hypothetical protein [Halobiforma nitratireducens]